MNDRPNPQPSTTDNMPVVPKPPAESTVEATRARPADPPGLGPRGETVATPTHFVHAATEETSYPDKLGDYRLLKLLGKGGMGAVFLAEDMRLGRKVALKLMRPRVAVKAAARERFLREARAASAVEHDNIVPIWHVGEDDGVPYIAMPLLQGEMLETRLKRGPIQPLGVTLKVAREVAAGLAAAHAKGLIHRDIKPANVWIEGDPSAADLPEQIRRSKILDFGLARLAEDDGEPVSDSGTILGTPAYMSPEQGRGLPLDHKTDLFSLGVMLYRMTTGVLPFTGPTTMATLAALVTVEPPAPGLVNPSVPPALSSLIMRLLEKKPERRPRHAKEVVATIRQIVQDLKSKRQGAASGVYPADIAGPRSDSHRPLGPAMYTPPIGTELPPPAPPENPSDGVISLLPNSGSADPTPSVPPTTPPHTHPPLPRSTKLLIAGLAVAVVVLLIALIVGVLAKDRKVAANESPPQPAPEGPARLQGTKAAENRPGGRIGLLLAKYPGEFRDIRIRELPTNKS